MLTPSRLLIISPKIDLPTSLSRVSAKTLYAFARGDGWNVDNWYNVSRAAFNINVKGQLQSLGYPVVAYFGHGDADELMGVRPPINGMGVWNVKHAEAGLFAGSIMIVLACSAGKEFLPAAVRGGALAAIGSTEDVIAPPVENLEAVGDFLSGFTLPGVLTLRGYPVGIALTETRLYWIRIARKWKRRGYSIEEWAARSNGRYLTLIGDKNAAVKDREAVY